MHGQLAALAPLTLSEQGALSTHRRHTQQRGAQLTTSHGRTSGASLARRQQSDLYPPLRRLADGGRVPSVHSQQHAHCSADAAMRTWADDVLEGRDQDGRAPDETPWIRPVLGHLHAVRDECSGGADWDAPAEPCADCCECTEGTRPASLRQRAKSLSRSQTQGLAERQGTDSPVSSSCACSDGKMYLLSGFPSSG